MNICVGFSLGKSEINQRHISFPSIELKRKYVEDENRNRHCRRAYFYYQAAKTIQERIERAEKLNNIRYSFAVEWAKDNLK